jgi:hypothetical protein
MSEIMSVPKYARVLDTRLEALSENNICYALKEGAAVQAFVPLVASSYSNQSLTFNLNNIADFTARDSRLAISITAVATISVQNTTANPVNFIQSDNFGFKSYPVNKSISSIQHQINQASITLQSNEILDAITRLNVLPMDSNFYENTQPDYIDSYAAATGTNFNPLQPYTTTLAGDGVFKPRSLNWTFTNNAVADDYVIPPNSTRTIVITAKFYEPLVTPYSNVSSEDSRALYAITGELISIQFVPDVWSNMFAFYAPAGLTILSPSNSIVNLTTVAPVLNCIYLTPKEGTIAQIPRESVYQYNDYSIFSNTIQGCPAGQSITNVSSQVVSFTNMPNKILVYARLSNNSRSAAIPDKYLALQSFSVVLDNGLPVFNGASQDQLYDVSKRNALQMPRACFKQSLLNNANEVAGGLYGCGSVMVIDPQLDCGTRPSDSNGSGGRFIFQVQQATFTNNTEIDFPAVTLYVVGINAGVLQRVGSAYRSFLLTTPPDIINEIKALPPISYKMYNNARFSNSFLMGGGISDWFKKAYNLGTRAYDLAKDKVPQLRQGYDDVMKVVGDVKQIVGKGARGTRLFGENPRPIRSSNYFQ